MSDYIVLNKEQIDNAELFEIIGRGKVLNIQRNGVDRNYFINKCIEWDNSFYLVTEVECEDFLPSQPIISERISLVLKPLN